MAINAIAGMMTEDIKNSTSNRKQLTTISGDRAEKAVDCFRFLFLLQVYHKHGNLKAMPYLVNGFAIYQILESFVPMRAHHQ